MIGELAAISSALVGTLSNIILKRETAPVSAIVISATRGVYGFLFNLILIPFFGGFGAYATVSPWLLGLLVVSTIIGQVIGDTLFFRSIATFGVARTMPVVSAYPLVTTILAVIFLHEPLGWGRFLGVVLVVGGLMFLTQSPGAQGSLNRGRRAGYIEPQPASAPLWMLYAPLFTIGLNIFLLKPVLDQMNVVSVNLIRQTIMMVVLGAITAQRKLPLAPPGNPPRYWFWLSIAQFLGVCLGSLLFLYGVQLAGAARGGTLASVGPLFALLLSPIMLGEKITRFGVIGSILTVGGVWVLLYS